MFDIGHSCFRQLKAGKTRYPLTSKTLPYRGLRVQIIKVACFNQVMKYFLIAALTAKSTLKFSLYDAIALKRRRNRQHDGHFLSRMKLRRQRSELDFVNMFLCLYFFSVTMKNFDKLYKLAG